MDDVSRRYRIDQHVVLLIAGSESEIMRSYINNPSVESPAVLRLKKSLSLSLSPSKRKKKSNNAEYLGPIHPLHTITRMNPNELVIHVHNVLNKPVFDVRSIRSFPFNSDRSISSKLRFLASTRSALLET